MALNLAIDSSYGGRPVKSPCSECLTTMLKIGVFVMAIGNILCLDQDQTLYLYKYGIKKVPSASAFAFVQLTNIILTAGIALDWCILLTPWMIVYAFLLMTASLHYLASGILAWLPGMSYSLSLAVVQAFGMDTIHLGLVALLIPLACFILVFVAFILMALDDFRQADVSMTVLPSFTRQMAPPAESHSSMRNFVPTSHHRTARRAGRQVAGPDLPPTYAQTELPPKYEESMLSRPNQETAALAAIVVDMASATATPMTSPPPPKRNEMVPNASRASCNISTITV